MKLTNKQAIEAQLSLISLLSLNLPVRCGLDIALISVAVDKQVEAFRKVRDSLIKNYQIKVKTEEKPFTFTTSIKGEDDEQTQKLRTQALNDFSSKLNELFDLEGEDIANKIHLPIDTNVQPSVLKPLLGFIEMING